MGWALLSRQADPDEERQFDFAATTNAGTSWTVSPLQVTDPSPGSGLSSSAWIDFVDASHGWISVAVNQGSGPPHSFGVLLTTEDGGKTWSRLKQPPAAKTMLFRTPQDGWLAEDGDLFRTRDSGKTWQQISLNASPVMKSAVVAGSNYLPLLAFHDATHGSLLLGYVTLDSAGLPLDGSARTVLFSTADGGDTWSARETAPSWDGPNVTLTDDTVLAAGISPDHQLTLTKAGAVTSSVQANLTSVANNAESVRALTVLDANRIWLLAYSGVCSQQVCTELLSSSDGGVSWSKITPPNTTPRSAVAQEASVASPAQSIPASPSPRLSASPSTPTATVSVHLGFDSQFVICPNPCTPASSISAMQTWWNKSPYFDTSLYLPHAENHNKPDPALTATWVASIQQQGWGLVPIWVGLQAPCVNTPGYAQFSSDPATAQTQGSSDADLAANSMASFGLSNTIVYVDIENYDTTNTSCRAAVTAFLTGWVTELHADGFPFAGVYGNPDPAGLDFSQVSPKPDDVWIAKGDNRVTIWGLQPKGDPNLSDSLWIADQRIHQYRINHPETYGGVSASIDDDIDDAPVVTSNTPKIYSQYSPKMISYQPSPNTIAWSVNGSGPSAVNSSVQVGGNYYTCNPFCGQTYFAFEYTDKTGAYTTLNLPGPNAYALGINNAGTIVGCYNDCGNGFIYSVAGGKATVKTLTIGTNFTSFTGINDDNQMVGYWADISGPQHGFIYLGWPACNPSCTVKSIDVQGATATVFRGINGQGQAAGYWQDGNGNWSPFTYSISTGTYNYLVQAPGSTTTFVFSINSNGQITGTGEALGASYGNFVYDENSQMYAQLPDDAADVPGSPNGINDQGVIVGENDFVPGQAFMATPIPQ